MKIILKNSWYTRTQNECDLHGLTLQAVAGWPPTITPQGTGYHGVTILPLALWFSYFDNRPYGKGLIKT
jgi:hypothetical protein